MMSRLRRSRCFKHLMISSPTQSIVYASCRSKSVAPPWKTMTSQSANRLGSGAVTCSTPERCRERQLRDVKQRQRASAFGFPWTGRLSLDRLARGGSIREVGGLTCACFIGGLGTRRITPLSSRGQWQGYSPDVMQSYGRWLLHRPV
jgi:hypothetical protein